MDREIRPPMMTVSGEEGPDWGVEIKPRVRGPPFAAYGSWGQSCFVLDLDPDPGKPQLFSYGGRCEIDEFALCLRLRLSWEFPTLKPGSNGYVGGFKLPYPLQFRRHGKVRVFKETLVGKLKRVPSFPVRTGSAQGGVSYGTVTLGPRKGQEAAHLLFFGGQRRIGKKLDEQVVIRDVAFKKRGHGGRFGSAIHSCPQDALLHVLSFLPPKDLCALRLANRSFALCVLASHDRLWGEIFKRITRGLYLEPKIRRAIRIKRSEMRKYRVVRKKVLDPLACVEAAYCGKGRLDISKLRAIVNSEQTEEGDMTNRVKMVVVGDGAAGKTCLLIAMTSNRFPDAYTPTVFDCYNVEQSFGKMPVKLSLWDTAGEEDYDELRPLAYSNCDVFLLCFDVTSRNCGLANVRAKWVPEVQRHSHGAPIILVATKIDLREDEEAKRNALEEDEPIISTDEGRKFARETPGIDWYVETSAKEGINIPEVVFNLMCAAALYGKCRKSKGGRCGVM